MARFVQGNSCIEAFPPSGLPDQWRCALKSLYSIPKLVVFCWRLERCCTRRR